MLVTFHAQLLWCLLLTFDAEAVNEVNTCIFQSELFCRVLSTATVIVDLLDNGSKNILVKKLHLHLRKPTLIVTDCFSTVANISSTCNNTAILNTITDVLCRESNVTVLGVSNCWNLRNALVQILWNVEMWDNGPLSELDDVNACVFRNKSYIFSNVTKSQLRGKQFKVVTKQEVPYMLLEDGPNNATRAAGGCEYQLLEALAGYFSFTYTLTKPVDDEFGDVGAHGKWTGMIGYLQDEKADIALCGLSITKERETVVDFSTFYMNDPVKFITHTPGLRPRAFVIVRPFSKEVWLSVIGALLIASLSLQTMFFLSNRYHYEREQTTFNAIWYLGGTLTQQGSFGQ
ncbi:glutamate receptor ionotropic, delta-2-like [Limulus polyphemus]|uniref:Glutamate receptor ionotropic, delta-2-like n=1 Tax=Limulus polyphemus TaxID=6850 RepID=A0ABM1SEM6_LIMPO|nr:glutamate receptor ionotropic, delta-2-like [Limulus polyphemus]